MKSIVFSPLARASPDGGTVFDPYFNAHDDPFDGAPHGLLASRPIIGI